jgi:hypothetical protein
MKVPLTFLFKWLTFLNPLLSLVWHFLYVNFNFQSALSPVYACMFERYSLIVSSQQVSNGEAFCIIADNVLLGYGEDRSGSSFLTEKRSTNIISWS